MSDFHITKHTYLRRITHGAIYAALALAHPRCPSSYRESDLLASAGGDKSPGKVTSFRMMTVFHPPAPIFF